MDMVLLNAEKIYKFIGLYIFCLFSQGEKNEGFNVLYQNMKCGTLAAKELTDFFRESAKLEEENAKTHAKLAKQV